MKILLMLLILTFSFTAFAKKKIYRKTQSVSFDGLSVDGIARNPDGVYLMQKKTIKFMPLYKVREKFNKEIKSSVEFLR